MIYRGVTNRPGSRTYGISLSSVERTLYEFLVFRESREDTSLAGCYQRWTIVERRRRRYKRRTLTKVIDRDLQYIHTMACLFPLPVASRVVHSYQKGLSARTCAEPHVGAAMLYATDLRDFFPSITVETVKGMFLDAVENMNDEGCLLGKDWIAGALAHCCTLEDEKGVRSVPLGSKPAGFLSNSVLYRFDLDMLVRANWHDVVYTRYSDNLFFSVREGALPQGFTKHVEDAIRNFDCYGAKPFSVNGRKTRCVPFWRRQRMLGIVVNEKLNVPREREKFLRSALCHLYHDCTKVENDRGEHARAHYWRLREKMIEVRGDLSYLKMVNPEKAEKYDTQMSAIYFAVARLNYQATERGRRFKERRKGI